MIYHKVGATVRTELKVARSMDANKRTEANYLQKTSNDLLIPLNKPQHYKDKNLATEYIYFHIQKYELVEIKPIKINKSQTM